MKVLIGVDPHKASVAVAAVDEATGELLERASFPQDRTGLRGHSSAGLRRFPERRWAMENAGGLGRHLAVRLAAAGESVVDVPPKLSARVRVLSSWQLPQERRARCPGHRAGRLAQRKACGGRSRGRLGSAAPALREERGPGRRAYQGAKPPARTPAGSRPWRGGRKALGRSGSAHPARHDGPGAAPRPACAGAWLPRSCATSGRWTGRSPTSTGASRPRWKPRAPPSPRSSA